MKNAYKVHMGMLKEGKLPVNWMIIVRRGGFKKQKVKCCLDSPGCG
jgi:hypothetical protein